LVIVFGEKNREYLKPSEKEILADSPGTPNRYYLFERKPLAAASPFKSPLIPVAKAWNPFFSRVSF